LGTDCIAIIEQMLDARYWMLYKLITIKIDCSVKNLKSFLSVIPANAGIQFFHTVLDSGFRRSDGHWDFL
jgi:hypothetical protein